MESLIFLSHILLSGRRKTMREAVIVNALRTAVGKAPRGSLKDTRPDDMAARVIKELMARTPEVKPEEVEDVVIGCATPEAQQGMNMARQAALLAGLPNSSSAKIGRAHV